MARLTGKEQQRDSEPQISSLVKAEIPTQHILVIPYCKMSSKLTAALETSHFSRKIHLFSLNNKSLEGES